MTAALPRMIRAATTSAGPANPHDVQTKESRVGRLPLATQPQAGQVRLVFFGSTATTGTPASAALYVRKERSWKNAQLAWRAR